MFLENWEYFDKMEIFSFEGHTTEVSLTARRLINQLQAIEAERTFPQSLRQPAANLVRILQREKEDAANEFNTLKTLEISQYLDCRSVRIHPVHGTRPPP
ncbi:MAG: hypothetical protein MZV65_44340 [Chromatiales bacterium]|nr:hypothetical protein [Chromatiales bacterium]